MFSVPQEMSKWLRTISHFDPSEQMRYLRLLRVMATPSLDEALDSPPSTQMEQLRIILAHVNAEIARRIPQQGV